MENQNPLPPIEQPQSVVSHTPSSGPSKTFLILIVLIIIVAIGAGAYFLGMKNVPPTSQPVVSHVMTPLTPTPTVDPTANWQTYTSSKFSYAIKYPLGWQLTAEGSSGRFIHINPPSVTVNQQNPNYHPVVEIQALTAPFTTGDATDYASITADKVAGYTFHPTQCTPICPTLTAFFPLNPLDKSIGTLRIDTYTQDATVLEQMLPTLTFALGTSWKTYTNSQYGFTLTYPATGTVVNSNVQPEYVGTCGKGIKENTDTSGHYIDFDNFFRILIKSWTQPLAAYITQEDPNNFYSITPITGSGADEAVTINGTKPGISSSDGGAYDMKHNIQETGFGMISDIYKKGVNLFLIAGFQNEGDVGGCVWDDSMKKNWDVSTSIHFTQ